MKNHLQRKQTIVNGHRPQPMFRPHQTVGHRVGDERFFTPVPNIQRQDEPAAGTPTPAPDPMIEGLKITGERLLQLPAFRSWYEPRLDRLRLRLWDEQPSDAKAALITFVGVNVALAGLVFALNPEIREMLSGTNIGAPLGWIPYSPVSRFRYTLPAEGSTTYGFGADFTLNPYLTAIRERHPGMPLSSATLSLESGYNPESGGFSVTGGRVGLGFLGGGLNVEGRTFTSLSPYPQMVPSPTPGEPPMTLMQSVPGEPPLQTGSGFQISVSADLLQLFPGLRGVF
ncbi:MAG: hypothetical protein AABY83_11335 [Pseudomonadota bacterium]